VQAEKKSKKDHYTPLPDSRTEETIDDGKKKTTTISIIKNNYLTIYTKVVHTWGGVFYFMDGEDLTEVEYNNRTKPE